MEGQKRSTSRSPIRRSNSATRSRSNSRERTRGGKGRSPSRSRSTDSHVDNPGNNLYIANLSFRTNAEDLESTFGKFGKLEKCELIIDPITRESRGFAFITFSDVRDAQDAIKSLDGTDLEGRRIRVEQAKRRRGHEKTPGKYLGPQSASSRYGRDGRDSRDGRDHRGRGRNRSSDRGGYRERNDRGYNNDRYERRRSYDR